MSTPAQPEADGGASRPADDREPFLVALGERVKLLRSRRGMPRRVLAETADVSERHLANLETGLGNVSVLVLRQVAQALECPIAELLGDETTASAEWLLIRDLLHGRDEAGLRRAREALTELFAEPSPKARRASRIALVGLRGAGKSTLGARLAQALGWPFIELSREIERIAGCAPSEIHALYGANAYRRYERRALEEVIELHPEAVIATPGGLVSEAATFNLLLSHCFTLWLRASPEEHMSRVIAQGDLRPMANNAQAMEDLKLILAGREPFYAKADLSFDTSGRTTEEAFAGLEAALRPALPEAFPKAG
ncbi:helix-turn-helix transcriptional regulator [Derxia gummosa]|uniref:Shikimate kinase n=1 Tax=Derxia gummosa DSM 723 TaxID=1121388 RepID=A0A9U5CZZ2_9BURK|nr:helix-turn-helix transcriptional regulator [Derxia gummosa]